MKKLIVLLALGILLFGCVAEEEPQPELPAAEYGDIVTVDYVLTVENEIIDTSMEQVARDAGIYNPYREYAPLYFRLELNAGLINGFVKGIVGMKENETKTFTIPPGPDGYGSYDPARVYNVSRYYNVSAFEVVPRSYFEERNITIQEGAVFNTEKAQVFIHNISGDDITIMYVFHQGDSFESAGFSHVVVASQNLTYTMMLDVKENGTYMTTSLVDGKPAMLRVTKLTDDTITFDENHFLAGKTLVYNITLLDLEKAG